MQKKGDVWISAVLYFGLGILVISILLAAGLPVINKLRDKNVVLQTKEVMHTLDQNVREVIREGPGSQRVLTINIKKGSFVIDELEDKILWQYNDSRILISEPGIDVVEGKLIIKTLNAATKGKYNIEIATQYRGIADINQAEGRVSTLVGLNDLVIRNEGIVNNLVVVSIAEVNN